MKLIVPTSWDDYCIERLSKYCQVEELYGKLTSDFIGGGRPSSALPNVDKGKASSHIANAHKYGLKFNYLLNAQCLDNAEFTNKGHREIRKLLNWLSAIKVDAVTVTTPILLQIIKKQYPHFKVIASQYSFIDTVSKAKYWEDMGIDEITICNNSIIRDFKLLKEIVKGIKCDIRLIANGGCLLSCPFEIYHSSTLSHASKSEFRRKGFFIDYCRLTCVYRRISDPVEFIKSRWIRPEDLHYYEEIGIHNFKLVERMFSGDLIEKIVRAYSNRYFDGNLLDLLPPPFYFSPSAKVSISVLFKKAKWYFRPFSANTFKLIKIRKLNSGWPFYINNKDLDHFLAYFLRNNCKIEDCSRCNYCREISEKVVKSDPQKLNKMLELYKEVISEIISGKFFSYIIR